MATNRLRRRLDDTDPATLAKLTQNFCKIGTPLPALDARKRDPNEYKPIWQQEARDEQGRRRFHGAFMGGFSAGYFNTVGSKEGWTPSSFRSSRADKAKGTSASQSGSNVKSRPEDFMDEEDLADLKDATQLRSSSAYADAAEPPTGEHPLAGLFGGETGDKDGAFAAAVLDNMIRPASTSLGFQLLKRMGWKEGHGLGPKVTARRRRQLMDAQKIGGAATPRAGPSANDKDADDEAEKHLYPPPNTKPMQLESKSDKAGLGWQRNSSLGELLTQVWSEGSRRDQGQSSKAGALDTLELDSDGEADVFAEEQDIKRSTLTDRPPRGRPVVKARGSQQHGTPASGGTEESTWLDGRKVIGGFRTMTQAMPPDPWFAPPAIPKGWKPNPQAVWDRHLPKTVPSSTGPGNADGAAGNRTVDSTVRGNLLGEARMPGPPPALSDFLSAKARERLDAATAASLPYEQAETLIAPAVEAVAVPPTDPATARAALQGFMPFGDDRSKQSRYRTYLQSQADPAANVEPQRLTGQTDDHFRQELREFAKSAAMFRPMSTAMASRFTSASTKASAQDVATPAPGLWQPPPQPAAPSKEDTRQGDSEAKPVPIVELSPAQQAAKAGMFGHLTRTVESWYPVRLLCKRFNVPDPHPGKARESEAGLEASLSSSSSGRADPFYASSDRMQTDVGANDMWDRNKRQIQDLAQSRAWESNAPKAKGSGSVGVTKTGTASKNGGSRSIETLGLGDDERQGADTATYVKPPVDIFKAIFASDEEDSDTDDGGGGVQASKLTSGAGPVARNRETQQGAGSTGDPTATFRPAFIPRSKRKANGEDNGLAAADQTAASESGETRKKADKKQKKEKRTRPKGMLTFDLDGEDDAGLRGGGSVGRGASDTQRRRPKSPGTGSKLKQADGNEVPPAQPASTQDGGAPQFNRPQASDLF